MSVWQLGVILDLGVVVSYDNMKTFPCNVKVIVKVGFKRVYIFFLIFALKHRSWVQYTHNLSFEKKYEKYHNLYMYLKFIVFIVVKNSNIITWMCLRNELCQ